MPALDTRLKTVEEQFEAALYVNNAYLAIGLGYVDYESGYPIQRERKHGQEYVVYEPLPFLMLPGHGLPMSNENNDYAGRKEITINNKDYTAYYLKRYGSNKTLHFDNEQTTKLIDNFELIKGKRMENILISELGLNVGPQIDDFENGKLLTNVGIMRDYMVAVSPTFHQSGLTLHIRYVD